MRQAITKTSCATLALLLLVTTQYSAGNALQNAAKMTEAAAAFVAALEGEQRQKAMFPLDADERPTWSNLPLAMVRPNGLLIINMNGGQRVAVHDLMRASMSSQGYQKMFGIMRLDDILYAEEIDDIRNDEDPSRRNDPCRLAWARTRNSGNYTVAVFGDPASGGDWGWRLAGHHAAANFTVTDGRVGFTPMFLGSSPLEVQRGPYTGWRALSHEGGRGTDLMRSLTAEQRSAAIIGKSIPRDVFTGPGRRNSLTQYAGLKLDQLQGSQVDSLQALLAEFVHNAEYDAARAQMQLIEQAGVDELWFSWIGPVDINGEFYFRLHGPRLLIEYNRQTPNHDHIVVRDPLNDYGEDWLKHHYEEHHPALTFEESRARIPECRAEG